MTHFVISDTHFGQEATCTVFKRPDGTPLRPFASAEEMNEEMVRRWNEVVKPGDTVYHLGDVVMDRKFLPILGRLNGRKVLIRGNHDIFRTKFYMQYFAEVYGVRAIDGMILSHIPVHPDSITKRYNVNVHGHLHANDIPDGRYLNVSVEQIDYTPISLDEVRERVANKRFLYPVSWDKPDHYGPG